MENWFGVGLIAGEDGVCEPCRRGDIVNCQNPVTSGVTVDGGYAEVMIAEARAISSVPDDLTSAEAAPLLCAGICHASCGCQSRTGILPSGSQGRARQTSSCRRKRPRTLHSPQRCGES